VGVAVAVAVAVQYSSPCARVTISVAVGVDVAVSVGVAVGSGATGIVQIRVPRFDRSRPSSYPDGRQPPLSRAPGRGLQEARSRSHQGRQNGIPRPRACYDDCVSTRAAGGELRRAGRGLNQVQDNRAGVRPDVATRTSVGLLR